MIKILSVYRGQVFKNSGTPIRVRHLCLEMQNDKEVDFALASWDEGGGVFKKHLALTNDHLSDFKKILTFVKNNKVDVVVSHTTAASYFVAPLKFLTKAKIVLEMHGLEEEEARAYGDIGFLKYWLFKIWHIFFYLLCDLITTCSQSVTKIVARWNSNSISMCGGVDLEVFSPNIKSGGMVKRDEKIVIGYAGNARIWQGVDFLVSSFEEISKKSGDFKLCMLMSEKKQFPQGVEVVGPVPNEEVPKFLIDSDILVIPRPLSPVTKISYPSKLTEYLAMGKAIVVSDVGDMDLVVKHGLNGLVYKAGDMEGFINCIYSLKNFEQRDKLGGEARRTAENMSWQKLGLELLDNIKRLV